MFLKHVHPIFCYKFTKLNLFFKVMFVQLHDAIEKRKKYVIVRKTNDLGRKIFIPIIGFSIPYFLRRRTIRKDV